MSPPTDFVVRPLRSDDKVKSLSLGHADHQPLKSFLKSDAWQYEACSVARTHVLVDAADKAGGGRVWGYVTLVASEVTTTIESKPKGAKRWLDTFNIPAIKLARMAIDKDLQGKGWGTRLLDWAIALVNNHVALHVGCRLLVTDAKASAVTFYAQKGFTMLDTPENKARPNPVMFVMLSKLTAA